MNCGTPPHGPCYLRRTEVTTCPAHVSIYRSLWGSDQADGDGRSARADDRVHAVGRRATASNVEYRDVDITSGRVGN
jgi:hypothetical protein